MPPHFAPTRLQTSPPQSVDLLLPKPRIGGNASQIPPITLDSGATFIRDTYHTAKPLKPALLCTSPTHTFFCPSEGKLLRSIEGSYPGKETKRAPEFQSGSTVGPGISTNNLLSADYAPQLLPHLAIDKSPYDLSASKSESTTVLQVKASSSSQPRDEVKHSHIQTTQVSNEVLTHEIPSYARPWHASSTDLSSSPILPTVSLLLSSATSHVLVPIRPKSPNYSITISTRTMFLLGFVPGLWFCFFLGGWEIGMRGRIGKSHRMLPLHNQPVMNGEIVWKRRCRVAATVSSVFVVGFLTGALLLAVRGM